MPLYTCIADSRISTTQRAEIATVITDTHCSHTGAPPEFVHVIFNEYLGHSRRARLRVVGTIRAGRTADVKATMRDQMVARIAEILSTQRNQIDIALQDIPAGWAMEGGEVLPVPGSERDWMKSHWSS